MREKIEKLLRSSVESDIELAFLLILKHIPEEIPNIFNSRFHLNCHTVVLFIRYEGEVYRTGQGGLLHHTIIEPESLKSLGFKEVTL